MRGKRPMQEDTVHCQFHKDEQSGQVVGAFGVFDGWVRCSPVGQPASRPAGLPACCLSGEHARSSGGHLADQQNWAAGVEPLGAAELELAVPFAVMLPPAPAPSPAAACRHGGPVASRFVCDHLFNNLLAHHTFEADLFKAVEEAYCLTDKQYLQLDAQQLRDDGCTAVTAVLVGRRLVTAHVGDSRWGRAGQGARRCWWSGGVLGLATALLPALALWPALKFSKGPHTAWRLAGPSTEDHKLLPPPAACRAVLSNGKGAVALSSDHKPNRDDERGRIEDAGASVVWAGTWRVGGVLAVSRSFGNRMLKQFIIPHPEIREDHLQPGAGRQAGCEGAKRAPAAELVSRGTCIAVKRGMCQLLIPHIRRTHIAAANECLVLASDGLWDAVSNEEAARLALRHRSQGAEAAARALVAEAYVRGSQDNITAVVVFFQFAS
jgi:serine/threonine protein phosphatase PrpC